MALPPFPSPLPYHHHLAHHAHLPSERAATRPTRTRPRRRRPHLRRHRASPAVQTPTCLRLLPPRRPSPAGARRPLGPATRGRWLECVFGSANNLRCCCRRRASRGRHGHDLADDDLDISKFVRYTTRDTDSDEPEESSGSVPKAPWRLAAAGGAVICSLWRSRIDTRSTRGGAVAQRLRLVREEKLSVDVVDAANTAAADATNDRRRRRDRIMYLPIDPHACRRRRRRRRLRRRRRRCRRCPGRWYRPRGEPAPHQEQHEAPHLPATLGTATRDLSGAAAVCRRTPHVARRVRRPRVRRPPPHTPHRTTAASRDEITHSRWRGAARAPRFSRCWRGCRRRKARRTPLACGALRLRGFRTGDRSGAVLLGRLREDGHVYRVLVAVHAAAADGRRGAGADTGGRCACLLLSVPESSADRHGRRRCWSRMRRRRRRPPPRRRSVLRAGASPIAEVRCQLRALGLRPMSDHAT